MKKVLMVLFILHITKVDSQIKKPFPTGLKIQSEEIIIRDTSLIDSLFNILYIKNLEEFGAKDENSNDTLNYWERIKAFKNVYTKTDLEEYVIKNNLTEKVPSVSDRIGIYNLSNFTGEFLVAEIHFKYLGGYQYEVELEITKSKSLTKVYHVKRSVTNWGGLKRPLIHTLFNDIYYWCVENKQSQEVIKLSSE